ncbi:MAG TPA: hypothetical protein VFT34_02445 [Verrucomicrobiae bacterium]|nr:hypothetical protein [Verrucomicrobiae bacterium]
MMPSEPDKKMDELLRTYARKRREDAGEPIEMHPATRRLLQAEAARLRPREATPRRTPWSWLLLRWPRVAFAVGVFALLAVAVWNWIPDRSPSSSPSLFAKKDQAEKAASQAPILARNGMAAPKAQLGGRAEQDTELAKRPQPEAEALSARPLDEDRSADSLRAGVAQADIKLKEESAARGLRLRQAPAGGLKDAEAGAAADSYSKLPLAQASPVTNAVPFFESADGPYRGATRQPSDLRRITPPASPSPNTSTVLAFDTRNNEAKGGRADFGVEKRDGAALVTLDDRSPARARATGASEILIAKEPTQPPAAAKQYFRFKRQAELEKSAPAKTAKESAPPTVLLTFDLEQDGDRVRVIDTDGSVYAGRFLTGAEIGQARAAQLGEELNRPALAGAEPRRQSNPAELSTRYFNFTGSGPPTTNRVFRASGTNRTIGQFVTIEASLSGGLAAVTNGDARGLRPAGTPPPPGALPADANSKIPAPAPLSAAVVISEMRESQRLVGTLRIGASNETQLIAVPMAK